MESLGPQQLNSTQCNCYITSMVCGKLTSLTSSTQPFSKVTNTKHRTSPVDQMATKVSLYKQLQDSRRSDDLTRRKYIPNNELHKIVTRDNIILDLNEHQKRWSLKRMQQNSKHLANRILESGQKLFVILVNLNLSWGVKNLLEAGLTDEDLPLSKHGNRLFSSMNSARSFDWPVEWEEQKLEYFVEKQWLVLAPIFRTEGAHRQLASECPLPFVIVEEADNGPNNVVYKALVDPSHHEGFEVSMIRLIFFVPVEDTTNLNKG